jgi:hypothetical protein
MVLCLLIDRGQALVSLLSGGVRRRLRLSAIAPRLTPPDYPPAKTVCSLVYDALSRVGGPDTRTRHWQFIPFDPFLPGGMLLVVLPHQGHLSGRDVVSSMNVQEKSFELCLTYKSKRSNMSLMVPGRVGPAQIWQNDNLNPSQTRSEPPTRVATVHLVFRLLFTSGPNPRRKHRLCLLSQNYLAMSSKRVRLILR